MKTLIEQLRKQYLDSKQMLPVQVCHEAADALERLENEATEWEVTVDNLQAELEKAQMHIKHIGNDALRTENADLREAIEHLNSAWLHKYQAVALELAALKQQEPIAYFGDIQTCREIVWYDYHTKYSKGTQLFLAAGAQPVP